MSWGRVDDKLHSHPKVLRAGLEAMGLWVICMSYCKDHPKTNGVVPKEFVLSQANNLKYLTCHVTCHVTKAESDTNEFLEENDMSRDSHVTGHVTTNGVPSLTNHHNLSRDTSVTGRDIGVTTIEKLSRDLCVTGLWEEVEGGYRFHDWDIYNPIEKRRLAERERQRKCRENKKKMSRDTSVTRARTCARPLPTPINDFKNYPLKPPAAKPEPEPIAPTRGLDLENGSVVEQAFGGCPNLLPLATPESVQDLEQTSRLFPDALPDLALRSVDEAAAKVPCLSVIDLLRRFRVELAIQAAGYQEPRLPGQPLPKLFRPREEWEHTHEKPDYWAETQEGEHGTRYVYTKAISKVRATAVSPVVSDSDIRALKCLCAKSGCQTVVGMLGWLEQVVTEYAQAVEEDQRDKRWVFQANGSPRKCLAWLEGGKPSIATYKPFVPNREQVKEQQQHDGWFPKQAVQKILPELGKRAEASRKRKDGPSVPMPFEVLGALGIQAQEEAVQPIKPKPQGLSRAELEALGKAAFEESETEEQLSRSEDIAS